MQRKCNTLFGAIVPGNDKRIKVLQFDYGFNEVKLILKAFSSAFNTIRFVFLDF